MKEITKDMTIMDLLQYGQEVGDVLMSIGMHCLGCAAARGETIEQAAAVHGVDSDELVAKLRSAAKQI